MISEACKKTPKIIKLNSHQLVNAASYLPSKGKLAISSNKLVYLDIDDAYIHQLFPFVKNQQIKKPDYFGEKSVGAHITVIYPEEDKLINNDELNQEHDFIVKDVVAAEMGLKTYYAILVESPSLLKLRRRHGLSDALSFKGYSIGFHVTIGVSI